MPLRIQKCWHEGPRATYQRKKVQLPELLEILGRRIKDGAAGGTTRAIHERVHITQLIGDAGLECVDLALIRDVRWKRTC